MSGWEERIKKLTAVISGKQKNVQEYLHISFFSLFFLFETEPKFPWEVLVKPEPEPLRV